MSKLIVNLFGAPNAGKTVAASSIFAKLKKRHRDVVLVNEYAKEMVLEHNQMALRNQLHIWSNQQYRLFCAHEHAPMVVTDSPLLLGLIYQTEASPALQQVILEYHKKFNNFNIFIELDQDRPYSMVGRVHNIHQSLNISEQILGILHDNNIPYLNYRDYDEDDIVDLIVAAAE